MSKNHKGILLPEWVEYIPQKETRNRAITASIDSVLPRPDLSRRKDKHPNTAWKSSRKEENSDV